MTLKEAIEEYGHRNIPCNVLYDKLYGIDDFPKNLLGNLVSFVDTDSTVNGEITIHVSDTKAPKVLTLTIDSNGWYTLKPGGGFMDSDWLNAVKIVAQHAANCYYAHEIIDAIKDQLKEELHDEDMGEQEPK